MSPWRNIDFTRLFSQLVPNRPNRFNRLRRFSQLTQPPANVTSISTVALLDLLGVRATTGNARRLARTMRSLGWVGLKSRRLMPGGWRDTEGRGWARPVRVSGKGGKP